TSGSTSEPKLVPLRARHLLAYARDMRRHFALGPDDRSLHVMPMFHAHGLRAALFNALLAGSGVVCLPMLDLDAFFLHLTTFRPTWYSAGFTVHRAILDRVGQHADAVRTCRLRFIRSGSGRLDLHVLRGLETAFEAPVLERYGQSETGTVTANPLP